MDPLAEKLELLLKGLFALKEQQGPLVPTIKPAPLASPKSVAAAPKVSAPKPATLKPAGPPQLGGLNSAISALKSSTKVTSAMNTLREPFQVKKVPAPKPIPGDAMTPESKKDPAKVAEQLKNPKPTKPNTEVLKVEANGQWSLT